MHWTHWISTSCCCCWCSGKPMVYARPDLPVALARTNVKAGGCIVHTIDTVRRRVCCCLCCLYNTVCKPPSRVQDRHTHTNAFTLSVNPHTHTHINGVVCLVAWQGTDPPGGLLAVVSACAGSAPLCCRLLQALVPPTANAMIQGWLEEVGNMPPTRPKAQWAPQQEPLVPEVLMFESGTLPASPAPAAPKSSVSSSRVGVFTWLVAAVAAVAAVI